jgi:hypothetical protein
MGDKRTIRVAADSLSLDRANPKDKVRGLRHLR